MPPPAPVTTATLSFSIMCVSFLSGSQPAATMDYHGAGRLSRPGRTLARGDAIVEDERHNAG
jgi:hypothetical protein